MFDKNGRYVPLGVSQKLGKDWCLIELFCARETPDPKNRSEVFERVFMIAVSCGDDVAASRLLEFVFGAIDDAHLLAFVDDKRGELRPGKECEKAKRAAIDSRVETAKKLWDRLPESESKTIRVFVAQDETAPERVPGPTMVKTRVALLKEIAGGWAAADDEGVAALDFDFLVTAKYPFLEYKKALFEAVRGASGRASQRRIAYALAKVARCRDGEIATELRRILSVGWARTGDERMNARMIQAIAPAEKASGPALDFLTKTVEEFAVFDRGMSALRESLQNDDGTYRRDRTVTLIYTGPRQAVITSVFDAMFDKYGDRLPSSGEVNAANAKFEDQCDVVRKWISEGSGGDGAFVIVRLLLKRQHEAEPILTREAVIGR